MKILAIILLFTSVTLTSFSQDVLVLTDGSEIKGKITELGIKNVKYSFFKDSVRISAEINKSEVFMILFESGRREIITDKNKFLASSLTSDKPELQRIGKRIFSYDNLFRASEIQYVIGKDLFKELSKAKTSVSISNGFIFGGLGIFVLSGIATAVASAIYTAELDRFNYYYQQGHKWSSGNNYSVDENLSNLKTASEVVKVSEPIFLVGAASISFGIVFKITSYHKMDKVLNAYNFNK